MTKASLGSPVSGGRPILARRLPLGKESRASPTRLAVTCSARHGAAQGRKEQTEAQSGVPPADFQSECSQCSKLDILAGPPPGREMWAEGRKHGRAVARWPYPVLSGLLIGSSTPWPVPRPVEGGWHQAEGRKRQPPRSSFRPPGSGQPLPFLRREGRQE
jgi:hypothetical protein